MLLWVKDLNCVLLFFGAVNTKNWYRKETDLWAEFGKKHHSTGNFPQSIL
jgi:hypothetical protein